MHTGKVDFPSISRLELRSVEKITKVVNFNYTVSSTPEAEDCGLGCRPRCVFCFVFPCY